MFFKLDKLEPCLILIFLLSVPLTDAVKAHSPSLNTNHTPVYADISQGFSKIAEPAIKSVVNVTINRVLNPSASMSEDSPFYAPPGSLLDDLFRDFFEQMMLPRKVQALASGFLVKVSDTLAYIVTSYHAIEDAKKIKVLFYEGTEMDAKVHAYDARTDIALLEVDLSHLDVDKRNLTVLDWGDSNRVRVGDWVLAVGNPFGLGSTVTAGIVSMHARQAQDVFKQSLFPFNDYVDDFIQHDAAINMGNSGGPILNLEGKVVGINTIIISPSGGNVGIGFAVPSSLAKGVISDLFKFGHVKRGWLGMSVQPVTKAIAESMGLNKVYGVIVHSVVPESPAAKASLKTGDVILGLDGKEINNKTRLSQLVGELPIGKETNIRVWRQGKEFTLHALVGESKLAEKLEAGHENGIVDILDIKIASITPKLKERFRLKDDEQGIVILNVKRHGLAWESGLRPGDVIVEVNQRQVITPADFIKVVEDAKRASRQNILLLTKRKNESLFVLMSLNKTDDEIQT